MRRASYEARCLIGRAEGYSLEAYQDSGGVWTIGWGTTKIYGTPVFEGMVITYDQAVEFFNNDMEEVEGQVEKLVKVHLTDNQFSALVSFVYNIGIKQFSESTLLALLNKGDYAGAASEFDRWIYDDGEIQNGLISRRKAEKKLFMT